MTETAPTPETLVAMRDLVGWHGERVLAGMKVPPDDRLGDWPDEYMQHLVAEGTVEVGQPYYVAPEGDVPSPPGGETVTDTHPVHPEHPEHPEHPTHPEVVDVAGTAIRPPQQGGAKA